MRILHVADLHLQGEWFEWLAADAPPHDILVIAGDLQNAFSNVPMHTQAREIARWLVARDVPTIVCSGNHDYWSKPRLVSVDTDAEAGWLRRLRGQGRIVGVDGDTVSIAGLTLFVNGWLQPPAINAAPDVLVTHAPPSGCLCAGGPSTSDCGDPFVWPAVETHPPKLMLCGHVHEPFRFGTRWPSKDAPTVVLVPGCDEQSETPAYWFVNTETHTAVHSTGAMIKHVL